MIKERNKILHREGVAVNIILPDNSVITSTALIGRANKQFNNMISLEAHRRGHFLPDVNIDNGCIVHNIITNEYYLCISFYYDVIQGKLSNKISHMLICNSLLDVSGEVEQADNFGNIKKSKIVKYSDLMVYTQKVTADLKQYNPGLKENVEYLIYCKAVPLNLLDILTIKMGAINIPLKTISLDYMTFNGIVVIEACSETRGG